MKMTHIKRKKIYSNNKVRQFFCFSPKQVLTKKVM
eukprot:CCRYP_010855-RA/>CCRYP_010855-RA protein AED:0.08 eAED:0.08 QI:80/1/1/1/0/0/2/52/34